MELAGITKTIALAINSIPHRIASDDVDIYVSSLASACERFEINSNLRIAAFIAQTAYESDYYGDLTEDLYYTRASRIKAVWPKRFPTIQSAIPYTKNPAKLANKVYANRLGNGDEASGDGYRFSGKGFIQLTGKDNYAACSKAIGIDLITNPTLLESPTYAALSAAWFWQSRGLNTLADSGLIKDITRKINGGEHGIVERVNLYNAILDRLRKG